MTRKCLSERIETPVSVNLIDDHSPPGSLRNPSAVDLEAYISSAVQTVVNEETNLSDFRKQMRKVQAA